MSITILKMGRESIDRAAEAIDRGGVIVFPTDTLYGLGCNPFIQEAVERVFTIKKRRDKPLPVLASTMERLEEICIFDERSISLAERFWPGGLTLVLPARVGVPASLDSETIAVRIPGHREALELIDTCHGLLVGTSANITDGEPPRRVEEAVAQLGGTVDLYLDGGPVLGLPSTVIDLSGGEAVILRRGATSLDGVL